VEQARLSDKHAEPALASAQPPESAQKKSSLMSDQTREALHRLAQALRRAAGLEATPAAAAPGTAPKSRPIDPKTKPAVPDRRAEAPDGRGLRP